VTRVEDRLSELLHQAAAPSALGVSFEEVTRRARRRRVVRAIASTSAVVAVVAGVAAVVVALPDASGQRLATGPPPTARAAAPQSVSFQGITFTLPRGWSVAKPSCGPLAEDTVVVGTWSGLCPYVPPRPATAVRLTSVYGPGGAQSWPGRRTVWQGQPAWVAGQTSEGVTTVTLTLPWLNAAVAAQSADPAKARALLDRVSARSSTGLQVPQRASSVFIQSLAGRDGDGQQRNATVTAPADVRRLLADLRALPPLTSPTRACDGSWWPSTALLTVHSPQGVRTYAARFDSCGLVVAGTGSAAAVSQQLLSDVKRLVPNSGL
jgi:hypothetical protein